jgi:hypothetical protein
MRNLRLLNILLCLGIATAVFAADKPAAKGAEKGAAKPAEKTETEKEAKPASVGDMPAPPPRLSYQGVKGQPGLAHFDNLQGNVSAEKSEAVAKALADAKMSALFSLYAALRNAHEIAVKADSEVAVAEKDAERDKAKLDKIQAEVDQTKDKPKMRAENARASNQLKSVKSEADRSAATLKKHVDAAKTTHDGFAAAKEAYDKALADAQPAIDTFRKEGGFPEPKETK